MGRPAPYYHHVMTMDGALAGDVMRLGDRVSVELHRGGRYADPSRPVMSGGRWIRKHGWVVHSDGFLVFVRFDDGDTQVMSAALGEVGYPYQNARLEAALRKAG